MISARKLLEDSFKFLLNNPLLLFYGFIYLLPVVFAVVGVILLTISVGTISIITFNFPTVVSNVFGVLFGSFFTLFFMVFFFFVVAVLSLALTAYVQSHLKGHRASVRGSIKKSWAICSSILWVVPLYLTYYFLGNSPLWLAAFVAFCYVPQLLVDGHTSLSEIIFLSWEYFKKTFWVLMRFLILISILLIALLFFAMLSLALATHLKSLPGASLFFSTIAMILFFGIFLFCIIGSIMIIIGINKLYLEVKQKTVHQIAPN